MNMKQRQLKIEDRNGKIVNSSYWEWLNHHHGNNCCTWCRPSHGCNSNKWRTRTRNWKERHHFDKWWNQIIYEDDPIKIIRGKIKRQYMLSLFP